MLLISRRVGEQILLPTLGVTIQVCEIRGRYVRIGISAPPEISIVRGEVADQRSRSERQAASAQVPVET